MFVMDDKDYWCIVAISEEEEYWILKESNDCIDDQILLDGRTLYDNAVDLEWASDKPTGVYKLELEPVRNEDEEIESINVAKNEQLYEITE